MGNRTLVAVLGLGLSALACSSEEPLSLEDYSKVELGESSGNDLAKQEKYLLETYPGDEPFMQRVREFMLDIPVGEDGFERGDPSVDFFAIYGACRVHMVRSVNTMVADFRMKTAVNILDYNTTALHEDLFVINDVEDPDLSYEETYDVFGTVLELSKSRGLDQELCSGEEKKIRAFAEVHVSSDFENEQNDFYTIEDEGYLCSDSKDQHSQLLLEKIIELATASGYDCSWNRESSEVDIYEAHARSGAQELEKSL